MDYIEVTITKKTVISKEQLPALEALQNKKELFENDRLLTKLKKLAEKSKDCEIEFDFNDEVW